MPSAYLQWRFHSGERVVARGPLVSVLLQASREAVLNRSVEHREARKHTFHNITAVYDLLAIALVKRAQFNQLADVRITCALYQIM